MLFNHRSNRRSDLYAENMHYLEKTKRKIVQKSGSEATNDSALSWRKKVCNTIGGFRVEVKVSFLFEDQTTFLDQTIVFLGRTAAKAKPILKPSSTSNPNSIPMKGRRWIDIEVQLSKDQSCYQMSKFINNLLRHREVGREEDAGVLYDKIIDKCKEKLDSKYWPNEVQQDLKMAPHWSAQKWIDVLGKGGQKKRFQQCLKPNEPDRLLYLRAFGKDNTSKDPFSQCEQLQGITRNSHTCEK